MSMRVVDRLSSRAGGSGPGGDNAHQLELFSSPGQILSATTPPTQVANDGLSLNEGVTGAISSAQLDFEDDLDASVTVTYTLTSLAAHGTLTRDGVILNVSDTFTQADIDAGKVSYAHDGSETTSDSFGFSVADSDATTTGQTFAITVAPVNDAPVVTAPTSLSGGADQAIAVTGISLADADAGSAEVTVMLSVQKGSLSTTAGAGVTVTGSGTSTLTLTGALAAINAQLAGSDVTFQSALHDAHDVLMEVAIDDGGASGDGGPQTDVAYVTIVLDEDISGDVGRDRLVGTEKDTTLSGGDGDDKLFGAAGDDVLSGEGDNDRLKGSSGDDTLNGGDGDDRLAGQGGNDHIDGGDGIDTADFTGSSYAIIADLDLHTAVGGWTDVLANIERLIGSDLGDNLSGDGGGNALLGAGGADTLAGRAGADFLEGGDGDDQVFGGDDQDVLRGSAGGDSLVGENGDDVLLGGGGNDTLIGGMGADILNGGAGQDRFTYTAIEQSTYPSPYDPTPLADVIYGFQTGDLIDLSAIDADPSTPDDDAFHLGFDDGVTGGIQVRYDASADQTLIELFTHYDPDIVVDGVIILDGRHTLTAADFVL